MALFMKDPNDACDVMMKELSSICILARRKLHAVKQTHSNIHVGSRDSTRAHCINFVYRLIDNSQFVMGKKERSQKYVKHRTSNNLSGLRSDEWQMGMAQKHLLLSKKSHRSTRKHLSN